MKKILSLALMATFASSAMAGSVLWEQAPDAAAPAYVDQAFGDFPTFNTYAVMAVSFGTDVTIDSVTTYYTQGTSTLWPTGAVAGSLQVYSRTGALPSAGDLPPGAAIAGTMAVGASGFEFTASGLGINLSAGNYWVGLTPTLDFGTFGQEFHQGTADIRGVNSAARNPGGGFSIGTDWVDAGNTFGNADWEGAIRIEGQPVPEPASMAILGLGAAALLRRRRKA